MTRANLLSPIRTKYNPQRWQRLEHEGCAIYIQPETPDWLVPTKYGDQLLQALVGADSLADAVRTLQKNLPAVASETPTNEHRLAQDAARNWPWIA